ncbi:protein-export protein SecB [Striga asiatica]|uniref:Protein-export protein SecB n=1 Tax=Striga asiatica TaxID=4170 RepID=A0A5A7PR80_STRAF|nr:protein-export protein SecB [Striga asiatica]
MHPLHRRCHYYHHWQRLKGPELTVFERLKMEAMGAEYAVAERFLSSAFEALLLETTTAVAKSLVCFLLTAQSLCNTKVFPRDLISPERFVLFPFSTTSPNFSLIVRWH